jgi:hypothetical protein
MEVTVSEKDSRSLFWRVNNSLEIYETVACIINL